MDSATPGQIRKIALLGNHLPRQCGIATFTTDLTEALSTEFPELDCFVLAMNDGGRRHLYPSRVRFEIADKDLPSYLRAADWGIEDPRITFVPELGKYAVTYTAFSKGGPGVALALTSDFRSFERLGLVMQPDDKDAALLPRRIEGNWALLHRPVADSGAHVWVSFSPDLRNWGSHRPVLMARKGAWWDANKVGISPPLIETPRGWLMLYHGVRHTAAGALYRLGIALFDLERPDVCVARGDEWIFGPEAPYECEGDVPYVVFPCGYTLGADSDAINLYYGAADTCIALATGSIGELLRWLDTHNSA